MSESQEGSLAVGNLFVIETAGVGNVACNSDHISQKVMLVDQLQ